MKDHTWSFGMPAKQVKAGRLKYLKGAIYTLVASASTRKCKLILRSRRALGPRCALV